MEEVIEKLILEEEELGEKISNLTAFLNKDYINKTIGDLQYSYLGIQHSAMLTYRKVLILRIQDLKAK